MKRFILLAALLLPVSANAAIEKVATPTQTGIRFSWTPKVSPPAGWHVDEGSSEYFSFRAMAPDGSTFSGAETVMYAKANYKPRVPELTSLGAFVEQDVSDFRASEPGLAVVRLKPLLSADGRPFRVVRFSPAAGGNWELVAYGEEGDYYLSFVISSRTEQGLANAMPAFAAMLAGYRSGS